MVKEGSCIYAGVLVVLVSLWVGVVGNRAVVSATEPDVAAHYWPQWRGPLGSGVAPLADPPVTWGEEENVRWKVPIPGRGHATPVVWGERVYLLTAVVLGGEVDMARPQQGIAAGEKQAFTVLALDRGDGRVVWQRVVRESVPHEGTHADGTWASGSPATDGTYLFAYFGSHGLYALDLEGQLLWSRDFGDMDTKQGFGEGSSPFLYGDHLVILWDHEGDSFIAALDKGTGAERWRQDRDEEVTWSTPVVVEVDGRPQVVVNGARRMCGYDLASGKLLWEASGMTPNTVSSPVVADGIAYFLSGFQGSALSAIRLPGARGDLDGSAAILWTYDRDTPYVPSPLVYGDGLYFLKGNKAVLTCLDSGSGIPYYGPLRLQGIQGIYASPLGAAERIYIAGLNGAVQVLRRGGEYDLLALNRLDDHFAASPVAVGNELFLRGYRYLYCLAED